MVSRTRETFEARPRLVPPPGATASASLPGYRRAGAGAGRWDPLPPTAPPRHVFGACKPSHFGVLGRSSLRSAADDGVGGFRRLAAGPYPAPARRARRYAGRLRSIHSMAMTLPRGPTGVRLAARSRYGAWWRSA